MEEVSIAMPQAEPSGAVRGDLIQTLTAEPWFVPSLDFKEKSQRFQMAAEHILSTTFPLGATPSKLFSPPLPKCAKFLQRSPAPPRPEWGRFRPGGDTADVAHVS